MLRSVLHFSAMLALLAGATLAFAQAGDEAVRVTVMVNPDGSKTVYQTDSIRHEATATTTDKNGKAKGKVVYQLDADGRYETAQILGPTAHFVSKPATATTSRGGSRRRRNWIKTTRCGTSWSTAMTRLAIRLVMPFTTRRAGCSAASVLKNQKRPARAHRNGNASFFIR